MNETQLLKVLRHYAEYGRVIDVLCVGTPKLIGDAVGPLVGTLLEDKLLYPSVKIIGTLEQPVTSKSYTARLKELRHNSYIVVVDAALSPAYPSFEIVQGPMQPGAAVSKKPAPIGDISVKCYTGATLSSLMSCDLNCTYKMAVTVAETLLGALSYSPDQFKQKR